MLWDKNLALPLIICVQFSDFFFLSKLTEVYIYHYSIILEHSQLPIKIPCAHL